MKTLWKHTDPDGDTALLNEPDTGGALGAVGAVAILGIDAHNLGVSGAYLTVPAMRRLYLVLGELVSKHTGVPTPTQEIDRLVDWQNSVAARMGDNFDGDEGQEAIIDRWLDLVEERMREADPAWHRYLFQSGPDPRVEDDPVMAIVRRMGDPEPAAETDR